MDKIVNTKIIQSIHNSCDCYVAPFHGEGWGMPIHDAMLSSNQIITTKYGGVSEFLDKSSAHIINHKMGSVSNMEWSPLYNQRQNWAYPSIHHLSKIMRYVYKNSEEYKGMSVNANRITKDMTTDSISKIIEKNILSIGLK